MPDGGTEPCAEIYPWRRFSVPFTPPSPEYISPEEAARRIPNFTYQVYFSKEHSTKQLEENVSIRLR